MELSPNLNFPYMMGAQAQKHVTHNEAIRAADALIQLCVQDRDLATPPAVPVSGGRYIVASSPTGAWTGQTGKVAAWQDGAWAFYAPREGWLAWVADEDIVCIFDGSAWAPLVVSPSLNPVPMVGVNATADTSNRLAVASPATLLNHAGSGHQLKINKAAAADTASLLYQTAFSGRAEMGLAGDDDFRVKVSADGSIWRDGLIVERASGRVTFPNTQLTADIAGLGRYLKNRTPANLKNWTTKLTRMMRFSERPRFNLYGDSITLGFGGALQKNSPGQRLAEELTRRGFAARAHLFGINSSMASHSAFDPRFAFTGTWGAWDAIAGAGGAAMRCTSASGTVTYSPGYAFDSIEVWYVRNTVPSGSGGSMTITIDGGATQFSTPTSGGLVSTQTISQTNTGF